MDKCNAKELLKNNSLKTTKQRLFLLEEILENRTIFTVNDLFKTLNQNMDLVTIYRVLNIFLEKGLIREVFNNEDVKMYELACIHNPVHPHFNCRKCGKMYCLDAIDDKDLLILKNGSKDFIVEDIAIQITGLCSKCHNH